MKPQVKVGDRVRVCVDGRPPGGNYTPRPATVELGTWKVKAIYSDGSLYVVQGHWSFDFVTSWIRA